MPGSSAPSVRCHNATAWPTAAPDEDPSHTTASSTLSTDRQAVLYIVVVLLFYSIGIIVAIITYLKREKAEMAEEKDYEDYMAFRNDPNKWARYYRMQQVLYRLSHVEEEKRRRERRHQQDMALAEALRDLEAQEMKDEAMVYHHRDSEPGPSSAGHAQTDGVSPTSPTAEEPEAPHQTQSLLQGSPVGLTLVTCV